MPDDDSIPVQEAGLPNALPEAVHSTAIDVLKAAAADPALGEDLALGLLKRTDLPAEVLERLCKNGSVMKSRKVKLAVAEYPKTPRHISLPLLSQLFTFDLMQVALAPVTPADVKRAADEVLIRRLEGIPLGERISLARRASGRIAGALLLAPELRVIAAALENPRLTEAPVIKALTRTDAPAGLIEAVCLDPRWSCRREVRVALLRSEKTPLARALEYARSLPPVLVREVLQTSRLPGSIKASLMRQLQLDE